MPVKIEKYYPFTLSEEQKKLLEALLEFIDSDRDVFILKGYAGTGKTSMIQGVIKHLKDIYRPFTLMASTGRAARVLAEKAGYPASTVHGTIYVPELIELPHKKTNVKDVDYRIVFRLKTPNTDPGMIYFIDESSLLTNHLQNNAGLTFGTGRLLQDLFDFAGEGKIVFIGDPAQLPPVNTKFSAALHSDYLQDKFGMKVKVFELKKVMRYNIESGIGYNTRKLRTVIGSGRYPPLSLKANGFTDIKAYPHENVLIKKYYETIKRVGVDSCIYITLSNKQTAIVNHKIRSLLWNYKNLSFLKKGESLMVARNNYLYGLSNGDLVTVESIEDKTFRMAGLKFRYINIYVNDTDPRKGKVIKRVMIITDLLSMESRDLTQKQDTELLKNFFARMSRATNEIYDILTSDLNSAEKRKKINEACVKNNLSLDADDIVEKKPSKNSLRKSIIYHSMKNDPYLNALRVKYGYAITCHKAQGSEWENVFLQLEGAMFYFEKENLYRWVYTSMSRAEEKIHILQNRCIY